VEHFLHDRRNEFLGEMLQETEAINAVLNRYRMLG